MSQRMISETLPLRQKEEVEKTQKNMVCFENSINTLKTKNKPKQKTQKHHGDSPKTVFSLPKNHKPPSRSRGEAVLAAATAAARVTAGSGSGEAAAGVVIVLYLRLPAFDVADVLMRGI